MPRHFDVAVVGGGAAGLAAAITAGRRGRTVVICERLARVGKKILATGGGRCNLSNTGLSAACFTSTSPALVRAVFGRFGPDEVGGFFRGLGLELSAEGSRIFPATNQAASVLKVLELEVRRLGVVFEPGFEAVALEFEPSSARVVGGNGRRVEAGAVVLAAGGKAYPALGSNGSGYPLARRLGHQVVEPVPSAVPLLVRDRLCHLLQGQRLRAVVTSMVGGRPVATADGELLFAAYGLSGTAALDVSEGLSVALNRDGRTDAAVRVDFVPFLARRALGSRLFKRLRDGWPAEDLTAGLLPEKFGPVVAAALSTPSGDLAETAGRLSGALKSWTLRVHGTRGWNESEFTCGGIDAREVDPLTLRSKIREGLYLAGEILDVQGPRGGFNLGWAWASGAVAGLTQ